jgi:hypothetical protein
MKRALIPLLALAACAHPPPAAAPAPATDELEPRTILEEMTAVAEHELARAPAGDTWRDGAFLAALVELGELTGNARYQAVARAVGEAREWRYGPLSLAYLTLFRRDRDRRMGRSTFEAFDKLCDQAQGQSLAEVPPAERNLILVSLTLATDVIGRPRYRECADRISTQAWKNTPRDGWLLLAVTRLLEAQSDPALRERYRTTFRSFTEGAPKAPVSDLKGQDDASLDPLELRAFAAAMNRGYGYESSYTASYLRRAWQALVRQPRPQAREAAAAFLFAGAEVFRLALFEGSRAHTVKLSNPLAQPRFIDTAEIPWAPLARALGAVPGDPIVAVDARTGEFLPSQLLDENGDSLAEKLLVSVSLSGEETRAFVIRKLARLYRPARPAVRASGRFVPEAKDDFAWENDRVAFRVYGPAIEPQHLSSGIDVWAKRVREPVIDRWYQRADLHTDRGEGLDFYRVGPSRGCGGLGLWDGQQLTTSRNFRRWRVVADGPVRVAFQLDYDAWGPAQNRVTESKRISLDLGQNLSRIEVRFGVAGPPRNLPVAVGVVRRGEGTLARDEPTTWLSYVEPPQGDSGQIGCGVLGPDTVRFVESPQHYLLVRDHPSDRPFVYYAGAYWSKGPDFRAPDEWAVYLAAFSRRTGAPIVVSAE